MNDRYREIGNNHFPDCHTLMIEYDPVGIEMYTGNERTRLNHIENGVKLQAAWGLYYLALLGWLRPDDQEQQLLFPLLGSPKSMFLDSTSWPLLDDPSVHQKLVSRYPLAPLPAVDHDVGRASLKQQYAAKFIADPTCKHEYTNHSGIPVSGYLHTINELRDYRLNQGPNLSGTSTVLGTLELMCDQLPQSLRLPRPRLEKPLTRYTPEQMKAIHVHLGRAHYAWLKGDGLDDQQTWIVPKNVDICAAVTLELIRSWKPKYGSPVEERLRAAVENPNFLHNKTYSPDFHEPQYGEATLLAWVLNQNRGPQLPVALELGIVFFDDNPPQSPRVAPVRNSRPVNSTRPLLGR